MATARPRPRRKAGNPVKREKPRDLQIFEYLVQNEAGKCAPGKLLREFGAFASEEGVVEFVENLRATNHRQLLRTTQTRSGVQVRIHLNDVEICNGYGYKGKCTDYCGKIHLCAYQLQGYCSKVKNNQVCPQSHDVHDPHNRRVLQQHNVADLQQRTAFKALRYLLRWSKTDLKDAADDAASETQSIVSEAESWQLDNDPDLDDLDIDEVQVFKTVLKEYGGQCEVSVFVRENGHLGSKNDLKDFFDDVAESPRDEDLIRVEEGRITLQLSCVKICPKYKTNNPCESTTCGKLHICNYAVLGDCKFGAKCKRHHRLKNSHNEEIVKDLEKEGITEEDLLEYLKQQIQKASNDQDSDTDSVLSDVSRASSSLALPAAAADLSEVVHHILTNHSGSCKYNDLVNHKAFKLRNKQQIKDFVALDEVKDVLKIEPGQGQGGDDVRLALQDVDMCGRYRTVKGCSGATCGKFHLCKFGVLGNCRHGERKCRYRHDLHDSHNRKLREKLKLTGLKDEDILLFLKMQMENQEKTRENTETKAKETPKDADGTELKKTAVKQEKNAKAVEDLSDAIEEAMQKHSGGGSNKSKPGNADSSLSNSVTNNAESIYVEKIAEMYIREFNPGRSKEELIEELRQAAQQSKTGSAGAASSAGVVPSTPAASKERMQSQDCRLDPPGPVPKAKSGSIGATDSLGVVPNAHLHAQDSRHTQNLVLKHLLHNTREGYCTLAELQRRLLKEFPSSTDALNWVRGPVGSVMCAVMDSTSPDRTLVFLHVKSFRLCLTFARNDKCTKVGCAFLHLCVDFVRSGSCGQHGALCSLTEGQNDDNIRRLGIQFQCTEDVLKAVRCTTPKICGDYNSGKGCKMSPCGKFHMSIPGSTCYLLHDFRSEQNKGLMGALGYSEPALRNTLLLLYKDPTKLQARAPELLQRPVVLKALLQDDADAILIENLVCLDSLKQMTSLQMLEWLRTRDGTSISRLLPGKSPGKHAVTLHMPGLGICFGYLHKEGCKRENCERLHLCREFVADSCTRKACKYSHDIQQEHNALVLRRSPVVGLSKQDQLRAIRKSSPKVCLKHNAASGCSEVTCVRFHICADNVRRKCQAGSECRAGHAMATSEHNRKLLEMYDQKENVMFMMLVVPDEKGAGNVNRPGASGNQASNNAQKQEAEKRKAITALMDTVLSTFDGYCSLNDIAPLRKDDLEHPDMKKFFHLTTSDSTGEHVVLPRVQDLGLCYAYCATRGCTRNTCGFLHMCRSYLAGRCFRAGQCQLSHNVQDKQNAKVINAAGVPKNLSEDLVLQLVRNSLPIVCEGHNTVSGCSADKCFRFHVCNAFVKRACARSAEECRYGHSFDTPRNRKILEAYKYSDSEISSKVLAADAKPKVSVGTSGLRVGAGDAPLGMKTSSSGAASSGMVAPSPVLQQQCYIPVVFDGVPHLVSTTPSLSPAYGGAPAAVPPLLPETGPSVTAAPPTHTIPPQRRPTDLKPLVASKNPPPRPLKSPKSPTGDAHAAAAASPRRPTSEDLCHKHVAGACRDNRCNMEHFHLPYRWRYRKSTAGGAHEWKDCNETTNITLEAAFCNPALKNVVVSNMNALEGSVPLLSHVR